MTSETADLVVMGAGPAGLGAGLAAARAGARVIVVEAGPAVGGLCATRRSGALRYDLGGHIPFVRDDARLAWLRGLLGDDLLWVPRPVASWRDGLRAGRYLDQRPGGPLGTPVRAAVDPPPAHASAAAVLAEVFGRDFVDAEMRPYLEKIDGVPLERITGPRPLRLMRDQEAPLGFWFPRLGIGQLMDAMAGAVTDAGGQVRTGTRVSAVHAPDGAITAVDTAGPDGRDVRIVTGGLVVSSAPGRAAVLLQPPPAPMAGVRMRAVCIVYLRVPGGPLTGEAWVQVDHPAVPAARIFEMGNWSPDMTPGDAGVVGFECYCHPVTGDPVWGLDDRALADACAGSLAEPLGWLGDASRAELIEVVRMPAAYPLPDIDQLEAAGAGARALARLAGVALAPGAAVIEAIASGEAAVEAVAVW